MLAYMLLTCEPGHEKEIISEIRKLPHVAEINGIMGKYDIIVKVAGEVPGQIDLAITKIRSVKGITSSYSMTALYGQGGTIDEEIKK
jgi:DNA-binding Lrp family transcriptional regulator